VSEAVIGDAYTRLDQADVVLGPSFDGGYYLIGMKKPMKELFKDIPFGTAIRCRRHSWPRGARAFGYRCWSGSAT
jgi:glycosyltransferase A (GT-A) superfamily protein (DUF2064 family)